MRRQAHFKTTSVKFTDSVCDRPEVREFFFTTGDADIMLLVATPSVSAYGAFLEEFVLSAPVILQARSNFALRQTKFETALPPEVE